MGLGRGLHEAGGDGLMRGFDGNGFLDAEGRDRGIFVDFC